jgi:hypothetical protein
MPDIDATCSSCGKGLRVSEVVDVANMPCPTCGAQTMTRATAPDGTPILPPESQKKQKLRLQKISTEPVIKEPEEEQARHKKRGKGPQTASPQATVSISTGTVDLTELRERKRAERERRKAPFMAHGLAAWGVFFIIGGISTWLRYGSGQGMGILEPALPYAWVVVLLLHLTGITLGAQDNLLHGVLATVVPGYSFYFIFQLYESYLLRAVAAGVLIAFGQDGALQIWAVVSEVADDLSAWIGSGGGGINRLPPEM